MEQLKTVVDEMHSAVGPGCDIGASGRAAGARLVGRVVSLAVVAALWTGVSVAQQCVGDCDRSRSVGINELILGVNIALGVQALSACPRLADADGAVGIAQLIAGVNNALNGCPAALIIARPQEGLMVLAETATVQIDLPDGIDTASLVVRLDGAEVTDQVTLSAASAHGTLTGIGAGPHTLMAGADRGGVEVGDEVHFQAVALTNPDECEVLNDAACLLPYPSSRFLAEADTPTGYRLAFPLAGMPVQNGAPVDPAPYAALDGFNPFGPILMHFPSGVDPVASNAPRLLAERRTYDRRSLDPDSPTVVLDADTGERVVHFIEPDARAQGLERQVTFLHVGKSLTPGHRYIVAARNLIDRDGAPVTAEAPFAALRDRRPTDIAAIEQRREHFEQMFAQLVAEGIERETLVLAFDFVVRSEAGLTGDLVSMRDQAFSWLAAEIGAGRQTFAVDDVTQRDCSEPGTVTWKEIHGTFQVPLFLDIDPVADRGSAGVLLRGEDGATTWNQLTQAELTVAVPCAALDSAAGLPVLLAGHDFSTSGRDIVQGLVGDPTAGPLLHVVVAATDYWGNSAPDLGFIFSLITDPNRAVAAASRTLQGQLNTLVLARMLKLGAFNAHIAFQKPGGAGMVGGAGTDLILAGFSAGGGLSVAVAAASPDVERVWLETPVSVQLLLSRSVDYRAFGLDEAFRAQGAHDALDVALLGSVINEQQSRAGLEAFATHVTANPLPGASAKAVLMTAAWLDQYGPNLASEAVARTLQLPNLVGSRMSGLVQIPDVEGPLPSAFVVNHFGAYDLANPAHAPFIPPLANLPASRCSNCDGHITNPFEVSSAAQLILGFLQGDGQIRSYCNGLCDGGDASELPLGVRCDPLNPPTGDFCTE